MGYSYLMAVMGSEDAAFLAGYHPKNKPVTVHTINDKIMENDVNDTILVVGHGVANYLFFSKQENPGNIEYLKANCSIIKLIYENGKFTIQDMIDPSEY